ncbi:MAG: zf-HC2 domain-containing protein [Candidatus Methanofastidiosa archaeon]|nr:zf-HC2 domain-containing protein [Candidatus Methanofastidiosa archaeon]
MHEEINELLAGYVLGELSELESFRVREHIAECKQCSSELESLEGLLACTQHMKKQSADEHLCKSARGSLFATIGSEEIKIHPDRSKTSLVSLWRAVMNNKIIASATAAVIILFVVLGINFVSKQDKAGVAWGSIVERLEKIDCYTFRIQGTTTHINGSVVKEDSKVYYSSRYGFFGDFSWNENNPNIKIYGSVPDNTITVVYPRIKKYSRVISIEKQVNLIHNFLNDPGHILEEIMSFKYRQLDSKIIDGKKVEGIEINDPRFEKGVMDSCVARLWVDVETNLPVLYESRATAGGGTMQIEQAMDDFKWNPVLDENIFKPDLTEYTLVSEVTGQPPNEEMAVQMLRTFAEMTGGNYPDSLNRRSCTEEIFKIFRQRQMEKRGLQIVPIFWEDADFEWEPYTNLYAQNQLIGPMFYGQLIKEDKDVAYHGEIVTAKDVNAPLLRWKISDDEYRVIFGDLRIENVSIEELAALEADLNKLQFLHFPAPNLISEPSTPAVAWETLVERLEKVDNYTFRKRETTIGRPVKEISDIYYSSQYGCLMDLNWKEIGLNIKIYNSFLDNTSTVVYPRIEKYFRFIASGEEVVGVSDILGSIVRDITTLNYNKLGSKVIDDKEVEGIEINDPRFAQGVVENIIARLWVDGETNLPVLYEARATVGNGKIQIEQVIGDFKWDVDLDAHLFEPDLTEYTLMGELPEQAPNEKTAVQMLRTFSELTGGKYPDSLAFVTCQKKINGIYIQRKIKEIGLQRAIVFWEEDDFEWEPFAKINMLLRQTCIKFYGQLIKEDKDVAYHGEIVTAKDVNAPLLRWKISDDEYRVIFGDLHIENVSKEELAELETDINKLEFLHFPASQ